MGKKFLGVEFAPLNIPFERRLQTLAVIHYIALFIFVPIAVVVGSVYLLFSSYWWLVAAYAAWWLWDERTPRRGGWRVPWFRRLAVWRHMANYFPVRLIRTAPLSPERNYIFGYHPHGVVSVGALTNFGTDATGFPDLFPGIIPHVCTLVGQFWFPLRREYVLATGAVEVSRESIDYCLTQKSKGHAVIIVIGGAMEALESRPNHFILHLSRRKGFIRLALQKGADLVPVFSFGENDLFEQVENPEGSRLRSLQVWWKKQFGFSPPVFSGRGIFNYNFGLLPFRRPVNTVVGAPIAVERIDQPTDEAVNELHKRYSEALVALFEEHKAAYGVAQDQHITIR